MQTVKFTFYEYKPIPAVLYSYSYSSTRTRSRGRHGSEDDGQAGIAAADSFEMASV